MQQIVGFIGGVPGQGVRRNDDDFADRLNHRFTVALLVMFAVIVSTKQYVGDPINCWVPAYFTGSWEAYANSYCWVKNTYFLPYEDQIPGELEHHEHITYYQWVPLILLAQALLFYLPVSLWRTLNARAGVDVNNIVESGETFQQTEGSAKKEQTMVSMTQQMHRYLTSQHDYSRVMTFSLKNCLAQLCCMCCGRRKGNYLVVMYLLTKVVFVINGIAQLFLLNYFLGYAFHLYGIDVLASLLRGEEWRQSWRFPRVTMCDFKIRRLGNIQRHTVQCVLPINLFNEMIYLFMWFWMVAVVAVTAYSLVTWSIRSMVRADQHRYIKKHLSLLNMLQDEKSRELAAIFTHEYLRLDGVFIMRLVGVNTNDITATEFVAELFKLWRSEQDEEGSEKQDMMKDE